MTMRIGQHRTAASARMRPRADMAGVDWAAMSDRYRPLLDRVGSAEGADIGPAGDGTWQITRILPGESSVIGARSPLAGPGVAAAPGDLIVAVDGRPVDPGLGPNALLAGTAGKPVELTLRRGGADRRAVVVPLASEHAVRYYDLVARQRAAVREASRGRLGYLKIPDMMAAGWAELHRDLYTEFGLDGLIVDLRDTWGGDSSELVADKLARRIIGWTCPGTSSRSATRPRRRAGRSWPSPRSTRCPAATSSSRH
jgi:tricorn protease